MTNEKSLNSAERKLVQSLLDTDYKRFNYDPPKKIEIINKALAMKLTEINFSKFKRLELVELGKNLGLKFSGGMKKQALIEQIELVKKQFQKVNKNDN